MNLFKKKKAEITELILEKISVVTDEFQPVNGKSVIIKAENQKEIIFKAEKVIEGRAFGTFMIANEVDKQGHYYSAETVKKCADFAKDKKIKFNLNHKEGILKGVYLEDSFYNEDLKAWQGWVNFSKNEMLIKKAEEGKFHGFSIEGLGVIVEKAQNLADSLNENQKKNPLGELTSALMKTIDEIVYDSELSDIDKKGSLELAVLDYFDFANAKINSIFNKENNSKMEESEMSENITKAQIFQAIEEYNAIKEVKKAEAEKDQKIEKLEKALEDQKTEIAELKKAMTKNPLKADGEKVQVEKAEKVEGFEL